MQTRLMTAMAAALVTLAALAALGTSPGVADDDAPSHEAGGETADGIDWTGDLARAEALAATTGRPLMVVFR